MKTVNEKTNLAKRIAIKAHAKQFYIPENVPYSTHLYKVTGFIRQVYDDNESFDFNLAMQLGFLHDTIEDTDLPAQKIQELFGHRVCNCVLALTKDKSLEKSIQMSDSLNRIKLMPIETAVTKMADRCANLTNSLIGWSQEKKIYYVKEARIILDNLGFANENMAILLQQTIKYFEAIHLEKYENDLQINSVESRCYSLN